MQSLYTQASSLKNALSNTPDNECLQNQYRDIKDEYNSFVGYHKAIATKQGLPLAL